MAGASLEAVGEGRFRVAGMLDFGSVRELYEQGLREFPGARALSVDLAAVERADSAGIALLVEWTRRAQNLDQKIAFVNMPAQMRKIAEVSGLQQVLPLADAEAEE